MTVIYDMFDVSITQPVQKNRSSKQKRIPTGTMEIDRKICRPGDIKFQWERCCRVASTSSLR